MLPAPASQPSDVTTGGPWFKILGEVILAPFKKIVSQSSSGLSKACLMVGDHCKMILRSSKVQLGTSRLGRSAAASQVSPAVAWVKLLVFKSNSSLKGAYTEAQRRLKSMFRSPRDGENVLEALRDSRAVHRLKALDLPEPGPLESRACGYVPLCFGEGTSACVLLVPYFHECQFSSCLRVRDTILHSMKWWKQISPLYGSIHVTKLKVTVSLSPNDQV